ARPSGRRRSRRHEFFSLVGTSTKDTKETKDTKGRNAMPRPEPFCILITRATGRKLLVLRCVRPDAFCHHAGLNLCVLGPLCVLRVEWCSHVSMIAYAIVNCSPDDGTLRVPCDPPRRLCAARRPHDCAWR